jgi:hypothetical protein
MTTQVKPLISEGEYQEALERSLGTELAAICNLPFKERIKAIADNQQNFDTPHDRVWPSEGYTGPDLP